MGAIRLVFLGAPGVGKGTLAKMSQEEYGLRQFSTGDMLREAVKEGAELGEKAAGYMKEGKLVPDDVVIGILRDRLLKDCGEEGFVLDGFPRTRKQAEALEAILDEKGEPLDMVLNLEAAKEVLIERLSGRRQCESCGTIYHLKNMPSRKPGVCDKCDGKLYQREDDKRETIEVRFRAYREETAELIDYYRGKGLLKSVAAQKDAETTFEEIKCIINKQVRESDKGTKQQRHKAQD